MRKYYLYSLIAHSTAIEGSTIWIKAQLLLAEGVVAGGKTSGKSLDERT